MSRVVHVRALRSATPSARSVCLLCLAIGLNAHKNASGMLIGGIELTREQCNTYSILYHGLRAVKQPTLLSAVPETFTGESHHWTIFFLAVVNQGISAD